MQVLIRALEDSKLWLLLMDTEFSAGVRLTAVSRSGILLLSESALLLLLLLCECVCVCRAALLLRLHSLMLLNVCECGRLRCCRRGCGGGS